MLYSLEAVCNYFISKSDSDEVPINHHKIQKLMVYTQYMSIGIYNKKFFDGNVYAYIRGPIIPELYKKLSSYRDAKLNGVQFLTNETIAPFDMEFLDEVWNATGSLTNIELASALCAPSSLWQEIVDMNKTILFWKKKYFPYKISDDKIYQYYRPILIKENI